MKVTVYSRKAVESLLRNGFPENTAVISFYDPIDRRNKNDYAPVDYSGKAGRAFYVPVYDIDIEVLGDFGLAYETYFPEVNVLAKFIDKAKNDGMDIICQCEYGQSRSAGCAAAILEHCYKNGISIFADYRYYPNQLIFNKIYLNSNIFICVTMEIIFVGKLVHIVKKNNGRCILLCFFKCVCYLVDKLFYAFVIP